MKVIIANSPLAPAAPPNKGLTQMWGCHRLARPSVAAVYLYHVYHVRHACVCVYAVLLRCAL